MTPEEWREFRTEWKQASRAIAQGEPDKADFMIPLHRIMNPRENITINDVIRTVAKVMKVRESDIRSHSRKTEFIWPRHLTIYMVSELFPQQSSSRIGKWLKRDHTSILNSLKRAATALDEDGDFWHAYQECRARLGFVTERGRL